MPQGTNISENSRRIARNTVLLYFRMFLMMIVGLFTSRVVLRVLGVEDFGIYDAVGGLLVMFTMVTNTVSAAIGRYINVELGRGDDEKLKKVFCTSLVIMAAVCAVILLVTETAGLWYLHRKMIIPEGRMGAAEWVLQGAMLMMFVTLLSVPFNAVITAHEHMDAYAYISILEALLKLGVALALSLSPADKLKTYALLMFLVAVLVRGCYSLYCRRHFAETRGWVCPDMALVRDMARFTGWNFLGSGAYLMNTQGVNQLVHLYFGVRMNAARGVAGQIERVIRQFATNIAQAINPQLMKSYAAGRRDYAFELACKGSKYYFLVLFVCTLPFLFEADAILSLWLVEVPAYASLFTKLSLLCFLMDFTPNTLNILELAHGKLKRFYIITSGVAILVFPATWILLKAGCEAWTVYPVFLVGYLFKWVAMLAVLHADTGFPIPAYVRSVLVPMAATALPSTLVTGGVWLLLPAGLLRLVLVCLTAGLSMAVTSWFWAMTDGERSYILDKCKYFIQRRKR